MPSIFTKIINREIPAHIVWEDESHIAFLDINPNNLGHTLVVPKKETDYIFDLSDEEYTSLLLASKKIARTLKNVTGAKRIGVVIEGLEVSHTHIHLIPINAIGELNSTHKVKISSEEMAALAEKIRDAILSN